MNPPVCLWVTPVSNLAGVSRHILDAASVGIPGWRMVVACPRGKLAERLDEQGITVIDLPVADGTMTAVRSLRSTITDLRPAIVHSHLARADFLATMASSGLEVRLVSTEHHISPNRFTFHKTLPAAATMETAHHIRLHRFSHVIAVSSSTKDDMVKYWHTSTPITVVLNGVNRPSRAPLRGPGLRLLSLARLSAEKNIGATVRSFEHILRTRSDATLTVAGEGEELGRLETLATRLGISAKVSFPGFVDAGEAMATHDVLVQPSKSDNCSYTLLDAVVHGMGVVASPVGGNSEILPPRCVRDADDVDGLAQAATEQGLNISLRPGLPDEIPTVRGMTEAVSRVYETVMAEDPPLPRTPRRQAR